MRDKDKPLLCCEINDWLIAQGEERVLKVCQALAEHGVSREEINVLLKTEIMPQFEEWRQTKLKRLMSLAQFVGADENTTIN